MTLAFRLTQRTFVPHVSWAQNLLGKVRALQEPGDTCALHAQLHPATRELSSSLRSGHSLSVSLRRIGRQDLPYYRVWVDTSAPITRFRMLEANAALLNWVERSNTGFEVLQLPLSGFQYHWRSDLARVQEGRAALVSQTHLVRSGGDLEVDHVAAPLPRCEQGPVIEGCLVLPVTDVTDALSPEWEKVMIARRLTPCRLLS